MDDPWVAMGCPSIIHGYPWSAWIFLESIDTHRLHEVTALLLATWLSEVWSKRSKTTTSLDIRPAWTSWLRKVHLDSEAPLILTD